MVPRLYHIRHSGGRILVQIIGLLGGSWFIYLTGMTNTVSVLLVAMVLFGFFKGLYDSNIFASLYDVVPPSARATAVGVMNTVGWAGAAWAQPFFGSYVDKGGNAQAKLDRMSEALSYGWLIYVVAASFLILAAFFFIHRDKWQPQSATG